MGHPVCADVIYVWSVPSRVDAVLVTAVVAVLTAGASVGMGRGVGVVGGGMMHFSPEEAAKVVVQSCRELCFRKSYARFKLRIWPYNFVADSSILTTYRMTHVVAEHFFLVSNSKFPFSTTL